MEGIDKILDPNTGKIFLSEKFYINSNTKPNDLKIHFGQNELRSLSMGNGWIHYSIKNAQIAGEYFIFIFLFYKDFLKTVSFAISELPFSETSWNDWNKEKEIKNKSIFENWLSKQIGTQRSFAWGNISTILDEKSGSSAIVLNYRE
ncbi:hypothetical protein SNE26_08490 [Mucilaginibacter sp. cycad4]|uniref:hypothetical protein n=1 Tax=Mucilaginibacter sp. cycad4 TaxID=3342096 RepID=UPI002AAA729C|nr:hypothetical protein [Mucilaginibacter gossypii]WPV01809.1 hypothetical protein SNE26_08490 [Mucilaginibacter gossypii]